MQCPPFDAFDPGAVERLAEAVEIEFHPAGTTIFPKGAEAVEFLRLIRAGAVEVVDDGRVLDLMGPGEMFGYASLLSGLPTDFATRASEDTLTYRIPADAASEVLAQPNFWTGLRNTFSIFLLSSVPQVFIGLVLAAVLNANLRAKTFWRMGVLLPYVVAPVAVVFIVDGS